MYLHKTSFYGEVEHSIHQIKNSWLVLTMAIIQPKSQKFNTPKQANTNPWVRCITYISTFLQRELFSFTSFSRDFLFFTSVEDFIEYLMKPEAVELLSHAHTYSWWGGGGFAEPGMMGGGCDHSFTAVPPDFGFW